MNQDLNSFIKTILFQHELNETIFVIGKIIWGKVGLDLIFAVPVLGFSEGYSLIPLPTFENPGVLFLNYNLVVILEDWALIFVRLASHLLDVSIGHFVSIHTEEFILHCLALEVGGTARVTALSIVQFVTIKTISTFLFHTFTARGFSGPLLAIGFLNE